MLGSAHCSNPHRVTEEREGREREAPDGLILSPSEQEQAKKRPCGRLGLFLRRATTTTTPGGGKSAWWTQNFPGFFGFRCSLTTTSSTVLTVLSFHSHPSIHPYFLSLHDALPIYLLLPGLLRRIGKGTVLVPGLYIQDSIDR